MGTMDINEYRKRLKKKYGIQYVAHEYKGVRVPVQHTCSTHGAFSDIPFRGLYSTSPCPECRIEIQTRKQRASAKANRNEQRTRGVQERIDAISKNKVVKLLDSPKKLLKTATCHTSVSVRCLACSHEFETNIMVAAKLKYGCRTCTNAAVNKAKTISPAKVLAKLRAAFPETKILGLDKVTRKQSLAHVIFECRCGEVVTRPRFSFERPGALRLCKICTFNAIDRKDKGSPVKTARCKVSGKQFRVRGYEIHALRDLRKEGVDLSRLKDSSECKTFQYHYQHKTKNYFPDFMYRKQVIEVKSVFTAGLTGEDSSAYRRFAMLKAKARACLKQGFKFRLMLYIEVGRTLIEADLPARWWSMAREDLQEHLLEFRWEQTA